MKSCPFSWGLFPAGPLLCCRAGPFPSGAAGSHCLSLCDFRGARPTCFLRYTDIAASHLSASNRLNRLSQVCLCQTFSPALKPLLHLFPRSLSCFLMCSLQQTRGLLAASWLRSPGGCIQRFSLIQLCTLCPAVANPLGDAASPGAALRCAWPRHPISTVLAGGLAAPSSQHGQSSGEGFSAAATRPSPLASPPTFEGLHLLPIYWAQIIIQLPPSYLLPFISRPCLVLQRRVEQHDTDGETEGCGGGSEFAKVSQPRQGQEPQGTGNVLC